MSCGGRGGGEGGERGGREGREGEGRRERGGRGREGGERGLNVPEANTQCYCITHIHSVQREYMYMYM